MASRRTSFELAFTSNIGAFSLILRLRCQPCVAAPLKTLDFLDTKIAPLQATRPRSSSPYIGTDVDQFAKNFPRFQIDTDNKSRMMPRGTRGFLFNRIFYEEQAKNKVAHELDVIKRTMRDDQTTIADDIDLQEQVKKNIKQYRRITYQLTDEDAARHRGRRCTSCSPARRATSTTCSRSS